MTDNKLYHIDKVRINSKKSIGFIKEKLPIDKLQKESKNFKVIPPYSIAKKWG
jgi:ribosomal protein S25